MLDYHAPSRSIDDLEQSYVQHLQLLVAIAKNSFLEKPEDMLIDVDHAYTQALAIQSFVEPFIGLTDEQTAEVDKLLCKLYSYYKASKRIASL